MQMMVPNTKKCEIQRRAKCEIPNARMIEQMTYRCEVRIRLQQDGSQNVFKNEFHKIIAQIKNIEDAKNDLKMLK